MANRLLKRRSASLIIRETQIKTTMRYHITPVRMAIVNKSTNNWCWLWMWRKGNPHTLLVGMQIGTATVENSVEFPQKIKSGTALWPSDFTSGNITKETRNSNSRNICTPMFIAVLFTIAKIWKQSNCQSVDEWIKKLWHIYTMEYYSAIKKKIALAGVAQWIECRPAKQRVAGSIPSQGTCLGCRSSPQWGSRERQLHIDLSLPLSLSLTLSLKINKERRKSYLLWQHRGTWRV